MRLLCVSWVTGGARKELYATLHRVLRGWVFIVSFVGRQCALVDTSQVSRIPGAVQRPVQHVWEGTDCSALPEEESPWQYGTRMPSFYFQLNP